MCWSIFTVHATKTAEMHFSKLELEVLNRFREYLIFHFWMEREK